MTTPAGKRQELTTRVAALENALTAAGKVATADIDDTVDLYTNRLGPRLGAAMVARAWCDDDYRRALLADATGVLREEDLGDAARGNKGLPFLHLVVVENTPAVHNVVVCTLCSCYPLALLGAPPRWYKSDAYRARAVREPRAVLAEFGVRLEAGTSVRVWDSTADCRYMVLPQRPPGTEGLTVDELAALVTVDSLIGTRRRL
ncbi:nitrile hydratase subunit alpha [Streptomyces sulfonofaciens]|uniref:Nitrile hydratase subunit alpha n=1 Tax=Streptomyces sulfonofaciens TaxID=68272 RepID=A0A919GD82_9ACTN|nr:nitrile hydratase subunit alpha [Streptomyces sulfonofaciens]GHH82356.1 nitrile hydratase subunit alpha [Streptomyces sulfonofaciens]